MLHWLRQKWIRYHADFQAIIVVSIFLHSIVVLCLFFGYRHTPDFSFSISKESSSAIVRLLPLGAIKPIRRSSKNQKKHKQSSAKSLAKKAKFEKRKKTMVQKEKQQKKKSVSPKLRQVPEKNERAPEQVVEKIIAVQEQKKPEVEKQEVKKEEPVVEEVERIEEVLVPDPIIESLEQVDTGVPVTSDDVVYVTQKELDMLRLQQQLKDAIESVWASPCGMAEEVVCEVLIVIGWDGVIVDRSLIHATEIYIYDRAVEDAIDKLTFPQQLWGRTIAITFKP